MASITYNDLADCQYIYRATSGGTVFSANLAASTAFDLFPDDAVVNDAIYFASGISDVHGTYVFAGLRFNLGTVMSGTLTLVWEYRTSGGAWASIPSVTDNTVAFTASGVNTVTWPVPDSWTRVTVNGQERVWCRVRISAKTSLTEGGAQQTDKVQLYNFAITVLGYAVGSPASLLDIYNADVAGGWGKVSRLSRGKPYQIDCNLFLGDGTSGNLAALTITDQSLVVAYNIIVRTSSALTLGAVTDAASGRTGSGAMLYLTNTATGGFSNPYIQGSMHVYGSLLSNILSDVYIVAAIGSIITGSRAIMTGTFRRVNVRAQLWIGAYTIDDVFVHSYSGAALRDWTSSANSITAYNVKVRNCTYLLAFEGTNTYAHKLYLRDADTDTWAINWGYGGAPYAQELHRQYSINITVLDRANQPISGATVALVDKDGTAVFSVQTDAAGAIAVQYATSNKYAWASGTSPGVTTDTAYSPFVLTIAKSGYKRQRMVFTLSAKVGWTITLEKVMAQSLCRQALLSVQ